MVPGRSSNKVIQAVILAGGRGERLRPLTDTLPKPMVEVSSRPFLDHLLVQLGVQGVTEVLILGGYLGGTIHDYYKQDHKHLPAQMSVEVLVSPAELSPGERLLSAEAALASEFLLLYGDNYAKFSLSSLQEVHKKSAAVATLTLFQKTPGDIEVENDGRVTKFVEGARSSEFRWVELGYMMVKRDRFIHHLERAERHLSLCLSLLAETGQASSQIIEHPYFSVSDPQRLEATRQALSDRKVLLLDRDGVLNVKLPKGNYVRHPGEFKAIEDSWKSIEVLAMEGFSFVVISNQAGVEMGKISQDELSVMNSMVRLKFEKHGARLLGIHICPHHWDTLCKCRKPKPGLLYQAAATHNLILENMMMVGDQETDWEAALAAGSTPVRMSAESEAVQGHHEVFTTLSSALPSIRAFYNSHGSRGFG